MTTKTRKPLADLAYRYTFNASELGQMLGLSDTHIRQQLRDAEDNPVCASDVPEGVDCWLHIADARIPVHLHGANRAIVFYRRDIDAAFGPLFPVVAK